MRPHNRAYTADETAEIVAHAQRTNDSDAAQRFNVPRRTVTGMRMKAEQRGAEYLTTAEGLDQARQAAHEYARDDQSVPKDEAAFLHAHPEFTDKKVASLDVWGM